MRDRNMGADAASPIARTVQRSSALPRRNVRALERGARSPGNAGAGVRQRAATSRTGEGPAGVAFSLCRRVGPAAGQRGQGRRKIKP